MLQCAFGVCGDIDVAVRALYKDIGEAKRINATRQIIEQPYIAAGLQQKYAATMDKAGNMEWCREIRNQYAHCQWYHTTKEGLCFIDLENVVQQTLPPAKISLVTGTKYPVDVPLLSEQEAFFKYVQKSFWHLAEQYKIHIGQLKKANAIWPWSRR